MDYLDKILEKLKTNLRWNKIHLVVPNVMTTRKICIETRNILQTFKKNYEIIKIKCHKIANETMFVDLGKGHAIRLEEFDKKQKNKLAAVKAHL